MGEPPIVVARVSVRADARGNRRQAAACVAETRTEPGWLAYDMVESTTGPGTDVFAEQWTDRAALDNRMPPRHLTALVALPAVRVTQPPAVAAIDGRNRSRLM